MISRALSLSLSVLASFDWNQIGYGYSMPHIVILNETQPVARALGCLNVSIDGCFHVPPIAPLIPP